MSIFDDKAEIDPSLTNLHFMREFNRYKEILKRLEITSEMLFDKLSEKRENAHSLDFEDHDANEEAKEEESEDDSALESSASECYLKQIPKELVLIILAFGNIKDLVRVAMTCKEFFDIYDSK